MDENLAQLQSCMYQYSRAIYRSIKDLIDPYADQQTRLEYRRAVLCECEETMERLAQDPHYFARPDRDALPGHPPLLPDHGAGAGRLGGARGRRRRPSAFIEAQIEAGAARRRRRRCKATTRKGKACQRTPLPERDYCPSHQHLERTTLPRAAAAA